MEGTECLTRQEFLSLADGDSSAGQDIVQSSFQEIPASSGLGKKRRERRWEGGTWGTTRQIRWVGYNGEYAF